MQIIKADLDIRDKAICLSASITEKTTGLISNIDLDKYKQLESQIRISKILENADN